MMIVCTSRFISYMFDYDKPFWLSASDESCEHIYSFTPLLAIILWWILWRRNYKAANYSFPLLLLFTHRSAEFIKLWLGLKTQNGAHHIAVYYCICSMHRITANPSKSNRLLVVGVNGRFDLSIRFWIMIIPNR